MKTIKRILVICSIPFLLGACSTEEYGLLDASTEDIQEMLDSNQTGFVLIKDEEESQLLRHVEKAFLEKEKTAMQFDVFRNDASNENKDGLSNNPLRHNMPNVNTVYYINNGNVIEEYDLESSLDNQQESLEKFIEFVGDSYE
ncbi:hypothetical protein [Planococcus shixiaomingii]|uniref:hypothetical protein n=1 Tax=Planococcus shixiaomingii TaxID=3058393 RepID=UPI002630744E|nr:hypothetical protein [Planococcus sp. N022]WKA55362.1 hypothetical protein QWY21_03000 [Planococcus sp. N022]